MGKKAAAYSCWTVVIGLSSLRLAQGFLLQPTRCRRPQQRPFQAEHNNNDNNHHREAPFSDLSFILQQLDEREIRYPPSATRKELQKLLLTEHNKLGDQTVVVAKYKSSHPIEILKDHIPLENIDLEEQEQEQRGSSQEEPLLPQRGDQYIHFPSNASRVEGRPGWQEYGAEMKHDQLLPQKPRQASQRALLKQTRGKSPWVARILRKGHRTLKQSLKNGLPTVVDRAVRTGRLVSRELANFAAVDETGVLDVDYEYLHKEEIRPTKNYVATTRAKAHDGEAIKNQPQAKSLPTIYVDSPSVSINRLPLFHPTDRKLLLPAPIRGEASTGFKTNYKRPRRHRPNGVVPERPIYSPYHKSERVHGDALNRLGGFLVDTADWILWGAYDSKYMYDTNDSVDEMARREDSKADGGETEIKKHWKDRVEERLDSMMGIHEDGELYNRWVNLEELDRKNEGGFDPVSVAQGRQPKRSGVYRGRKKTKYEKAIWEEEGNLISLLFGRTKGGDNLLFDKLLDQDSGSVLNMIKSVSSALLLVTSYLCRWASVRGALPQPIVVLGLGAAALCAPPRRRFRALMIALVLLRTGGELVHGYLNGDDGWEAEEAEYEQ
jgi:hypothetical protein